MSQEEQAQSQELAPTRIAVYDDLLSAPRTVDIQPCEIGQYIEQIAAKTYEFAQQSGGTIPYTVIKEVCENFIHAKFKDPCVSILDRGNTIRFTDRGPGIEDKERVQLPGFTSATTEMRQYIRGVGSGLPTVKEYLRFSNGRLIIEDNIQAGTVVTITVDNSRQQAQPVVYREHQPAASAPGAVYPQQNGFAPQATVAADALDDREVEILLLACELGKIGATDVKNNMDLSVATAQRALDKLEQRGYLEKGANRKRSITEEGMRYLNGRG